MGNNYFVWCYLTLGITSSCLVGQVFSKSLYREFSCGDETLNLKCDGQLTRIAIHQAFYTEEFEETTNFTCPSEIDHSENDTKSSTTETPEIISHVAGPCYEDIRLFLNRGCSGQIQCKYNYFNQEDRKCEALPKGILVVSYDCVRESALHKYCNSKLRLEEGYIASPGYPLFYPKLENCNWTIESLKGQKVIIHMLDVHMRPPTTRFDPEFYPFEMLGSAASLNSKEPKCEQDYLQLVENKEKTVTLCGEDINSLQRLELDVNRAVLVRFTTRDFFPASGFLLHYKVLGCRTLRPPPGGFLISRNDSLALYACDDGKVFSDSLESERSLQCVEDHRRWNMSLSSCVVAEDLRQAYTVLNRGLEKRTDITDSQNGTSDTERSVSVDPSFLEDIIIPSSLIAFLVLGNAVIIAVIFLIRRRHKSENVEEVNTPEIKKRDSLLEDYAEL